MHPWVTSDRQIGCTVCGMDLVRPASSTPTQTPDEVVLLEPGSVKVVGVQTFALRKQPLIRTLRVNGSIVEDESRHAIISAPVEGRIEALSMKNEGAQLRRREPMLSILSQPLIGAVNDYKAALNQRELNAVTNAQNRLEQLGLVWDQIKSIPQRQASDSVFSLLAPRGGTIVKNYVVEGQFVKEGEPLFEIADFTTMWFTFPAYEQDLPFIELGQVVEINTSSLPSRTLKARVTFISPNLDDRTHASTVRVLLEHPELHLRNRTAARGLVELDAPEVLGVPRTAVLWHGQSPRVYVEKAPGVYEPHAVKLGRVGDELYELLEGAVEGDRVVVSGNLLLDAQAQLNRHASVP